MKLGILGCGNMGKAYLSSLIKNKIFVPSEIIVCNRTEAKNLIIQEQFGVNTTTNTQDIENAEIIILGIKPQGLADLKFQPANESLIISLLVGTKIDTLQKKFHSSTIVRFMPNIGQYFELGMTGVFSNSIKPSSKKKELKGEAINIKSAEKIELYKNLYKKIDHIASAGAQAIWLEKEADINHIAAISGSGPAYFFAFADALKQSAQRLGFDEERSTKLALQTFLGAAEYVKQKTKDISSLQTQDPTDKPLSDLFQNCISTVASKGGTTQAALETFGKKNLNDLVKAGAQSAVNRGNELAQS